ncbi:MAG: CHAD domain-containing protein [Terriglobales bacterium]
MEASPILKPDPKAVSSKPKLGLRAWMERVLVECDHAADGFDTDPVHDLRVALRRCRSLADGLMAIDPDSSWKDMKKAGKKLFQALGELRDMQVMQEWIEKLSVPFSAAQDGASRGSSEQASDPVGIKLLDHVHARETECKQHALKDLNQFDRKQWRQWSRSLPHRAARVRPGSLVYLHLALEKWTAAYELHKHALRARSQTSFHELRIGIKRFRYTVENFLPQQHAKWGDDLKELQDLLGEVHDLDVLWATAIDPKVNAFADVESRKRWREKLTQERAKRIARYREKMVGRQSLWRVWREDLPAGPRLRAAALSRLGTWAGYLDPDFSHSQRVTQLALLLYDGLQAAQLLTPQGAATNGDHPRGRDQDRGQDQDQRAVLHAAALMHDVGKAKGADNHSKASYRMIRSLARPLGWSAQELELAAVIARYHRGELPRPSAKPLQAIALPDRREVLQSAGILRLANALDKRPVRAGHETAPRLEVSALGPSIVVRVAGYSALDQSAEKIAAARHLLETALRRPIVVRPLRTPATGPKRSSKTVA